MIYLYVYIHTRSSDTFRICRGDRFCSFCLSAHVVPPLWPAGRTPYTGAVDARKTYGCRPAAVTTQRRRPTEPRAPVAIRRGIIISVATVPVPSRARTDRPDERVASCVVFCIRTLFSSCYSSTKTVSSTVHIRKYLMIQIVYVRV